MARRASEIYKQASNDQGLLSRLTRSGLAKGGPLEAEANHASNAYRRFMNTGPMEHPQWPALENMHAARRGEAEAALAAHHHDLAARAARAQQSRHPFANQFGAEMDAAALPVTHPEQYGDYRHMNPIRTKSGSATAIYKQAGLLGNLLKRAPPAVPGGAVDAAHVAAAAAKRTGPGAAVDAGHVAAAGAKRQAMAAQAQRIGAAKEQLPVLHGTEIKARGPARSPGVKTQDVLPGAPSRHVASHADATSIAQNAYNKGMSARVGLEKGQLRGAAKLDAINEAVHPDGRMKTFQLDPRMKTASAVYLKTASALGSLLTGAAAGAGGLGGAALGLQYGGARGMLGLGLLGAGAGAFGMRRGIGALQDEPEGYGESAARAVGATGGTVLGAGVGVPLGIAGLAALLPRPKSIGEGLGKAVASLMLGGGLGALAGGGIGGASGSALGGLAARSLSGSDHYKGAAEIGERRSGPGVGTGLLAAGGAVAGGVAGKHFLGKGMRQAASKSMRTVVGEGGKKTVNTWKQTAALANKDLAAGLPRHTARSMQQNSRQGANLVSMGIGGAAGLAAAGGAGYLASGG